jgi:thiamine-monophosphate kinase
LTGFQQMTSEFSFIEQIRRRAARAAPDLVLGIGDDTAIWREHKGRERLVTTDLLIEDVHFKLEYTPLACLGHKALAVSLSDIAAMGGKPDFALLSLGIPKSQISNPTWPDFFDSYFALADKHGVTLIGGDTSSSSDKLVIDSIVMGSCEGGTAIRRSGAQLGDSIYVTGQLGASATGLELLARGERLEPAANDLRQAAMRAHLLPEPRLAFAQRLNGLAHALMDVSDGLAQDLSHICAESGVDAIIAFDAVPIADCVSWLRPLREEAFSLAVSGGEDYELLFTAPPAQDEALRELAAECELRLTGIGEIIARRTPHAAAQLFLRTSEGVDLLAVKGYDHFE